MSRRELTFALTASMAAEFEQREAIGLTRPPARLGTRYFDSPAGDLMKASIVLCVRTTPDGYLQQLEAAGDPGDPLEWARPVPDRSLELDALPPPSHPAGALARECFALLMPVFDCEIERQVRLVRPQPGLRVEIACERGEIRAGNRTEQIAEVRLERKEGSPAAFYHYAMQWAGLHQAQLLQDSRQLRGLLLAGRQAQHRRGSGSPTCRLGADLPVAVGARQILAGHLESFLGSIGPVLGGTEPEAPHQLRDALRRFRAAIRFLDLRRPELAADGLPAPDDVSVAWHDLDQRARTLATAASSVCQADLLAAGPLACLVKAFPGDPALKVLGRSLAMERERQSLRLRASLEAPQVTAFVIEAQAAAESLPAEHWQDCSLGGFASARLEVLARRVSRRVRRAATDSDWHAVGLATRNLHYALDSCPFLPQTTRPMEELVADLLHWQSRLKAGHDLRLARGITSRALAHTAAPPALAIRAAALIDGFTACAMHAPAQVARTPLLALLRQLSAPGRGMSPGYHPELPAAAVSATGCDSIANGSFKEEPR